MRYGIDNFGECAACGEFTDLCLDCGCCENCCGNDMDCPSNEEDDPDEPKYFEYYWGEEKSAEEVVKHDQEEGEERDT
jgi:hypothetical protein